MLQTRPLGRTALQVSEISFGAWAIGGTRYGEVPERDAREALDAYVQQGGNFIDTARAYGESERILGDFLRAHGNRADLFIASKSAGTTPEAIRADLEESLQQIGTDYLDVYYLHNPPENYDEMQRVLDLFEQLKDEGAIRAVGASIKGPDVTQNTVVLCRRYIRSGKVDVLQVIFSMLRPKNQEMLREAQSSNVGVVARTVLESGFLTGKYAPDHQFAGDDHRTRWNGIVLKRILEEAKKLEDRLVKPPYSSLSQVALRFVLDEPRIASALVGAKSAAQVVENLAVADLPPLDDNVRKQLFETYNRRTEQFNING